MRLLAMTARIVGIGLAHHDHDPATRIERAAGVPLAAVDDVLVTVARDSGVDVRRVGRGDFGFGHREGGADFAGEQRLQPLLLVFASAPP
jgi:hypothetical protein